MKITTLQTDFKVKGTKASSVTVYPVMPDLHPILFDCFKPDMLFTDTVENDLMKTGSRTARQNL